MITSAPKSPRSADLGRYADSDRFGQGDLHRAAVVRLSREAGDQLGVGLALERAAERGCDRDGKRNGAVGLGDDLAPAPDHLPDGGALVALAEGLARDKNDVHLVHSGLDGARESTGLRTRPL